MQVRKVASDKYLWEPVSYNDGRISWEEQQQIIYEEIKKHIHITRRQIVWGLFIDWLREKFGP